VGFLSPYLGFKLLRVRAELKLDAFLTYLRGFGNEHGDPQVRTAAQALRDDTDWAGVLAEAERAEEAFLRSCHNQLAVPRSIQAPYLVVGKDRAVRHWNESAAALFGLEPGQAVGVDDLLRPELLGVKEGNVEAAIEIARASFASLTEDRHDFLVKNDPYELTMSPITHGPLAGGKVLVWREVKGEAERLDRAVAGQLSRVRDLVHKVTHRYACDLSPGSADSPAAKTMIGDLALLRGQVDERELLWKSEAQALIDQVTRQQEILSRLAEELARVRGEQAEALQLVRSVHGGEQTLHGEVTVLERDLERWNTSRRRLLRDLEQQATILERAKNFEEELRAATTQMASELAGYDSELDELRRFTDAAKLHSVNLSLVKDPAAHEYAARARAFSADLSRFLEAARNLGEKVRRFVKSHPGGALAAHLGSSGLDGDLLASIGEEQEKLGSLVQRWRKEGESILSGGQKAVELLQEAEKKSAVLTQLGETSLLINQQARGNLERWN
jgi:hypothetical protein